MSIITGAADVSPSQSAFVRQMGANSQAPGERKINFHSKILYPSVAVLALAACGSSSSNEEAAFSISPAEEAARVFAETDGDVSDILDGDIALSARSVSLATNRESFPFPDGEGNELVEGSLILQGDGPDLLVTFSTTDNPTPTTVRIENAADIEDNRITIDNDDFFFDLFVDFGSIGDLVDDSTPSGWAVPIGLFFANDDDGFGLSGRGIMGAETTDMMMEQLAIDAGSTSYFGSGFIQLRATDAGFNTFNGLLEGDLELVADFGAGGISGEMTDLFYRFREGQEEPFEEGNPDGSIIFDTASLGPVNGFEGTMSASAALRDDNDQIADIADGLTYSGAFYGPSAEIAGGAIEGGPTAIEGTDYIGHGYFIGYSD